ncbi:MAG: hypothetical protein IPP90_19515 [Gemmatimonadaceae bacterium]|nr:hypothetical protein [Gemmatimonadaceae bacterium]
MRGTSRLLSKITFVIALAVATALFAVAQGVNIFAAAGFAVVVGALGASVVAESVRRPLEELDDVARALVGGWLSRRASLAPYDEAGGLADSLRQLADQLSARRQELAAAEELLMALTESLNEGVVAVDARKQVVRINDTARRLLRLSEPVPFPAEYLPRDRALRAALVDVLSGREAEPDEVRVDDRTLSLTARPLPAGGAVLALYDLTPFRLLESVRRDFVANVSHELRTPLTVVSGFVETLTDEALPIALRRQFLGMVASNVQRMQRIVDDLLDLSRIESGGWLPNPVEQRFAALAEEIAGPLRAAAQAKGVAMRVEEAPDAPHIYADTTATRQILSNLAENALRHTVNGEVVLFSESATDGDWIGVRDTGTGIGAAQLPRIFERFYRADPGRSREAGGTGLGLAIVRHLAEAHGGRVRAESTPGVGTTIAVLFPRRDETAT